MRASVWVAGTCSPNRATPANSTGPHLHFVVQKNVGLDTILHSLRFTQAVDRLPNFAVGGEP